MATNNGGKKQMQIGLEARGGAGGGGAASAVDADKAQADAEEKLHRENVRRAGIAGQFTYNAKVTPAFAAMILERFAPPGSNRQLRRAFVRQLAADIRAGRWEPATHQGIAFREDGQLADGQHRLAACVMACVPISVPVTYGQPAKVFEVTDQGVPRGAKDLITVAALGVAQPANVAAVARAVLLVGGGKVSKHDVLEFVREQGEALAAAVRTGATSSEPFRGQVTATHLGAAAFLIRQECADEAAVQSFFSALREGAGLAPRSPLLVLRDALKDGSVLMENPQGTVRALQYMGAVLNGWNLWRRRVGRATRAQIVFDKARGFPVPSP